MRKPPLRVFWIDTQDIVWGIPRGSPLAQMGAGGDPSGAGAGRYRGGRIAVMPRPHPATFPDLKAEGVDVIVSLLEASEASELLLGDEATLCQQVGIEFLSLPVVDHGVPGRVRPVARMASEIAFRLAEGRSVAVHCFAGIGRSPLLIAAVLIDHGLDADEACTLISRARGRTVPEMGSQMQWLYAYERMRRGG